MGYRLVLLYHREGLILPLGDGIGPCVKRPHIIGVGNAKIRVETLGKGHELGLVTQVPLAKATGGVAVLPKHLGKGDLIGI